MKKTNPGSSVKKKRKGSSTMKKENPSTKHSFPDLISALPDSLLVHILSLLDMEEVIKTSLLSKRWRYLWKSTPCLCFGSSIYFSEAEFTKFIDRCLFHHKGSKIHKLHIDFNYNEDTNDAPLVDSWLHFAIKCKVEDFKIDFFDATEFDDVNNYDQLYRLPRSLYLCTTLTSLHLRGCNLNLPDSFQLGLLETLSLELLELHSDSIEHLSSSCPMLKVIYLADCNWDRDLNIVITNGFVKRLGISCYGRYGFGTVKINAPTLLSLGIYDCSPTVRFHVEELGSLISADLIVEQWSTFFYEGGHLKWNISFVERFLYDLRHVKHLKLCSQSLQVLSTMKLQSSDILSISATCLELKASLRKWELPGISFLLESCSNLEKLKIVNENFYDEIELLDEFIDKHNFEEEQYWELFETDMPSIMQNIKTIKFDLGVEIHHEEEFIRFLLKNAKVLERMVINTPEKHANEYKLLYKLTQRLTVFPRASANAKLFIK